MLSLIIGMFASTGCRKVWMAATVTLFSLAVLVLGIPLAVAVLRLNQQIEWAAWLELLSPSYSLSMASSTAAMLPSNRMWVALGMQVFIALLFFGLTTFLLRRVWKEGRKERHLYSSWTRLKYGSGEARRGLRAYLLQINPILWLSCRERFAMGHAVVLLVLASVISWAGKHALLPGPNNDFLRPMVAWIVGIPFLYMCFCFRLAAAASERFAVDRKAGALELILCTPMKIREIIRGHWLGLVRRFWPATLVLLALHAFALDYILEAIRIEGPIREFDLGKVIVRSLRHVFGGARIANEVAPFYIACLAVVTAAILIMVLWIALGWLGMALSLKLPREILAPWVSMFLLAVPPIPLFISALPIVADKNLFASNLFLGMLSVGATGFFIVLTNALIWLFLARRGTYRKLRAISASESSAPNSRSASAVLKQKRSDIAPEEVRVL
jgi:hypothetical protein